MGLILFPIYVLKQHIRNSYWGCKGCRGCVEAVKFVDTLLKASSCLFPKVPQHFVKTRINKGLLFWNLSAYVYFTYFIIPKLTAGTNSLITIKIYSIWKKIGHPLNCFICAAKLRIGSNQSKRRHIFWEDRIYLRRLSS